MVQIQKRGVHQPGFVLPGQGSFSGPRCPRGQPAFSANGRSESVQTAEVRLWRLSGRPRSCVSLPVHDTGEGREGEGQ